MTRIPDSALARWGRGRCGCGSAGPQRSQLLFRSLPSPVPKPFPHSWKRRNIERTVSMHSQKSTGLSAITPNFLELSVTCLNRSHAWRFLERMDHLRIKQLCPCLHPCKKQDLKCPSAPEPNSQRQFPAPVSRVPHSLRLWMAMFSQHVTLFQTLKSSHFFFMNYWGK